MRAELFTEDLGDTDGDFIDADWPGWPEWQSHLRAGGEGLQESQARDLGQQLFRRLLGGPENAEKWREVLDRAERDGRPIRLLIDAASDQIRDLPFGLLCQPYQDG